MYILHKLFIFYNMCTYITCVKMCAYKYKHLVSCAPEMSVSRPLSACKLEMKLGNPCGTDFTLQVSKRRDAPSIYTLSRALSVPQSLHPLKLFFNAMERLSLKLFFFFSFISLGLPPLLFQLYLLTLIPRSSCLSSNPVASSARVFLIINISTRSAHFKNSNFP